MPVTPKLDDAPDARGADRRSLPDALRTLLWNAVVEGATDVHLHRIDGELRILHRIDGILHRKQQLSKQEGRQLINQLRSAAELTVTRTFVPEEGQIILRDGPDKWEFRATIVPIGRDISAHLRVLDVPAVVADLRELGLETTQEETIQAVVRGGSGLVLICGSTGTGKTTTLYSMASLLDSTHHAVYSIEDPVEFRLPYAQQIEVDERHGLSMYTGLRTILRMDPDMILVGEIRDRDSAIVAARAALSGKLVLATIHAQDAVGAIGALHFIGVPNYVIAGSLHLVVAQNLIRRVCPACAQTRGPHESETLPFADYGMAIPTTLPQAVGCPQCHGYGYQGRTGVFEILSMDADMAKMIVSGVQRSDLLAHLHGEKHPSLIEHGLSKAAQGLTTMEELYRACGPLCKDKRDQRHGCALPVRLAWQCP